MARLLDKPQVQKASKYEEAGKARKRLEQYGMLSSVQAAKYLQLHKYTVKEYIQNGFIATILVGSRHYLEEAELKRLQALLDKFGSLAKARNEEKEELKRLEQQPPPNQE